VKRSVLWLTLSLMVVALGGSLAAPRACADTRDGQFSTDLGGTISLYSDPGSELASGVESASTTYATVSGYPSRLQIQFSPAGSSEAWSLTFGAPEGQSLQTGGVYDDALGTPQTPTLEAINGSEGCTGNGRFEVKDLAYDAAGVPTRVWILYELHCDDGQPALFGEVRLGEPAGPGPLDIVPSSVRWPADDFGTVATPVPVLFTADQTTQIRTVTLGGADPRDFRISQDSCTGLKLNTGEQCTVWVDLDPLTAGTVAAKLKLTTGSGSGATVPLQGFTFGGATRLLLNSRPGDDWLDGQGVSVGAAGDSFSIAGTPQTLRFAVSNANHDFYGEIEPPTGGTLTPGSTWTKVRDFTGNDIAEVDLNVDSSSCAPTKGRLSVLSLTADSHNFLTSVDLGFKVLCSGATGYVTGKLQWRAGDPVAAAPWMEPDATGAG
jgi:hypothetical protein